jgi:hypothetical protein
MWLSRKSLRKHDHYFVADIALISYDLFTMDFAGASPLGDL